MIDGIFLAVLMAGVTGLLVTPLALCEIVRIGRKNRELADRNAAQAVTIARLEWPLSVGEAPNLGETKVVGCYAYGGDSGWIVSSADGLRFRMWETGFPRWVEDRAEATRYARREDAEAVHSEDEDAWRVEPFLQGLAIVR